MKPVLPAALAAAALASPAAALDVAALWDYARPAESEARFRAALDGARGDDALVLRTQIARTYSLRGRFGEAHRELDAIEPLLARAGAEPRVRAALERGRTLRSAKQPGAARPHFERAFDDADGAGLQALAADALHMLALVEPQLDGQLAANRRVVDYARRAADAKVRYWQAPALNNMGVALNEAGRHAEALPVLEQALAAYRELGSARQQRIARWMVAHTLRRLQRVDEALAIQLGLEADGAAAGESDPYVFEELAGLYAAKGDAARAAHYEALKAKATPK